MAIGWLSVLKMVPWADVIESAPIVAQGAKKLWKSVGKKTPAAVAPPDTGTVAAEAAPTVAALQTQVTQLQAAVAELQQQMLESSALIGSLAEQNTQLIARVEVNRKRVLALAVALITLAAVGMSQLY